jgi:hypothetical protein
MKLQASMKMSTDKVVFSPLASSVCPVQDMNRVESEFQNVLPRHIRSAAAPFDSVETGPNGCATRVPVGSMMKR